jgi:hypothetical protein
MHISNFSKRFISDDVSANGTFILKRISKNKYTEIKGETMIMFWASSRMYILHTTGMSPPPSVIHHPAKPPQAETFYYPGVESFIHQENTKRRDPR